jgi:UDPglucose 6-dehydrogenase
VRIVGLGYVGLTTALGFSQMGHYVEGVDSDPNRIEALKNKVPPFKEDGIELALETALGSGMIKFFHTSEDPLTSPDFVFVCVPTPALPDGTADLRSLYSAVHTIVEGKRSSVLVVKSTVPVGTAVKLHESLGGSGVLIANNPEFLREGTALSDFSNPDRIVVGAHENSTSEKVLELYAALDCPKLNVSLTSAELIKYASNAYLALRLSFANEIAQLSERSGASFTEVSLGLSKDKRVGPQYLSPGPGWGGSCLPKDTKALVSSSSALGMDLRTVSSAIEANERTKGYIVSRVVEALGGSLAGKKVTVWGLAYKAKTEDYRDSPSVEIVNRLLTLGALVTAFDPLVKKVEDLTIGMADTLVNSCVDAELLLVLTEWRDFSEANPTEVLQVMKAKRVLDSRRILDSRKWAGHAELFWSFGEAKKSK